MRHWTYYWNEEQFLASASEALEGRPALVEYTGGSGFAARGIAPGDAVYIINWWQGSLRILGRFIVERLATRAEAEAALGRQGYDAPEHLLARPGTATPFVLDAELAVDDPMLDDLEFVTASGNTSAPKRRDDGSVDPQTFRNVREITGPTADLFDRLLGFVAVAESPPYRRYAGFDLVGRDDEGHEATAGADAVLVATTVTPRFIDFVHSAGDPELISNRARLLELLMTNVHEWVQANGAAIDGELEGIDVRPYDPSTDGNETGR